MGALSTKKTIRWGASALGIVLLVAVFTAGYMTGSDRNVNSSPVTAVQDVADIHTGEWTCSMHPQIRRSEPGQCPICGMDLIPVVQGDGTGASSNTGGLVLSPESAALAEVRVAPVERKSVTVPMHFFGRLAYDETRVKTVSAWFPGRIDRLYVDYTGATVAQGEKLADIYSPEFRTAWEELRQARLNAASFDDKAYPETHKASLRTLDAVKEKLRLLGMSAVEIESFGTSGEPGDTVALTSTLGGVVVHKNALEGMYVKTGDKLYTVADLSVLWALLDVYESDLSWIRTGQKVELTTETWPGETFTGTVSFIDPSVNTNTRTVKVRVTVPNKTGKLKPDMFVKAMVAAGQPQVKSSKPPLVIPTTAPLITGKRAVVYVRTVESPSSYEGREIELGRRLGDYYEVAGGLAEGDMVVVNGAFKIDSALQILARPSMMNPGDDMTHTGAVQDAPPGKSSSDSMNMPGMQEKTSPAVPEAFTAALDSVYSAYFRVQYALSHDSLEGAARQSADVLTALGGVDMTLLTHETHLAWMSSLKVMTSGAKDIAAAKSIEDARAAFKRLSDAIIDVAHTFGTSGHVAVFRFHCPMAFNNKGSDWLQGKRDLENPWFGSSMLKCGELTEVISDGMPADMKR